MATLIGVLTMGGIVVFIVSLEVRENCRYRSTATKALFATIVGALMVVSGMYLAVSSQIGG